MLEETAKKSESLVSGVLKFSISSWANLIIGFLSIVITTRLLAPETYGFINLFIAFADVLMYVIALGFDGALIRFYNEPPSYDSKNQLMYKCITISIVVGVVFGLIAMFLLGDVLSSSIFGFPSRILIALVFIFALERLILRYLNINFRMAFNSFQYNIQNILNNCLIRILVIFGAFFLTGGLYIVATICIGYFFIVVAYLYIQKSQVLPYSDTGKLNFSLSLRGYGEYIRFAICNAPIYIINYANTFLSLQIISLFCGTYFVGIFSSASIFGSIVSALSGGFSTYWLAYVYKNYNSAQARIKKMHDYVVICAVLLASLFVAFKDLIYLFLGSGYYESQAFYSLLLISPLLNFVAATTGVGIGISKKNYFQLITNIVAIILNMSICLFLVPQLGVSGAAIANAFAGVVQFLMNTFFAQRCYSSIGNQLKSFIGMVLLVGILILPALFSEVLTLLPILILIDVVVAVLFSKEIKTIVFFLVSSLRR